MDPALWIVAPMFVGLTLLVFVAAHYMVEGTPPARSRNPLWLLWLFTIFTFWVAALANSPRVKPTMPLPRPVAHAAWLALAFAVIAQSNTNAAVHQLRHEAPAYRTAMLERFAELDQAKRQGRRDIQVPPLPAVPLLIQLPQYDLQTDPAEYPNYAYAQHWGLTRIVVTAPPVDPALAMQPAAATAP